MSAFGVHLCPVHIHTYAKFKQNLTNHFQDMAPDGRGPYKNCYLKITKGHNSISFVWIMSAIGMHLCHIHIHTHAKFIWNMTVTSKIWLQMDGNTDNAKNYIPLTISSAGGNKINRRSIIVFTLNPIDTIFTQEIQSYHGPIMCTG